MKMCFLWLLAGVCCAGLTLGCGENLDKDLKLSVTRGSVTYNGSPLAGATVTFMPEKGPLAIGITDLKGEFKLNSGTIPGCAVGPAKVAVTVSVPGDGGSMTIPDVTNAPKSAEGMAEMSKKMAEMTQQHQKNDSKPKSIIPDRYKDANLSGLQYTIETDASKNVFKIELKD
jgi:hypothetical protein